MPGHSLKSPRAGRALGRVVRALALGCGTAAGLVALSGAPALAQVTEFSAGDYGKTVLPLRQSLGGAVNHIRDNGHAFEPIGQLRADEPLRTISRPVGRLDLLVEQNGRRSTVTCTASVVSEQIILTNYHCIPGLEGTVHQASLVLDYLFADGKGAKRIDVATSPIEGDQELDYSLVKLAGPLPEGVEPLRLTAEPVSPRERLKVVHHPAGQVKMLTEFKCKGADTTNPDGPRLRHVCDTLPGSSGAVILDSERRVVGLHHTGGLSDTDPSSFNQGTLIRSLVHKSAAIASLVGSAARNSQVSTAPADAGGPDTGALRANGGDDANASGLPDGQDRSAPAISEQDSDGPIQDAIINQ